MAMARRPDAGMYAIVDAEASTNVFTSLTAPPPPRTVRLVPSFGRSARLLSAGVFILLLNTAYLSASAAPTLFYFTNVVFHIFLGIVLAVVLGRLLLVHRRAIPLALLGAAAIAAAGVLFGVAITFAGAAGRLRWMLPVHIALMLAGVVPWLVYAVWHGARRFDSRRGLALGVCGVMAVALLGAPALAWRSNAAGDARFTIRNPGVVPASMAEEGRGPQGPFFPSSSDTNVHRTIPATFFMTSESCGRCHKDIYEQWKSSMHHFSSFNNQWYRKSIEYMQDTVGTQPSKWCAGCHDHAVFFNGRFDRPIKEQIDTPEAQAGLACTSCHSITRVHSSMGQGDFEIEYPPLHDLAASDNPVLRRVHDALLYLAPEPHRRTFLKPFHREQTAEFCSSCHKVHLDVPVNDYRWFRGFNDYDNWQASGVSGQGARSFYYPAKPQKCADCHMPLVDSRDPAAKQGKVRSPRFPAANTALPYVNHDPVQLKVVQDFLRDGQISVDVFGITRVESPPADRGEFAAAEATPRLASTFAVGE